MIENAKQRQLEHAEALAHLGSWIWVVADNTVSWSDELYRIYGLTPGEFGASFEAYLQRVHPDDRERVQEIMAGVVRTGGSFDFEERIVRPDGEVRWLRSRGEAQMGDSGEVVYLLGSCQDVTEQKEAAGRERELIAERAAREQAQASERRQQELLTQLEEERRRLRAAVRERDEVLAVVSHDLRNPLNSIGMAADQLREPDLSPEERDRCIGAIQRGISRAVTLIQDLLDIARLEQGALTIDRRPVDPQDVLRTAANDHGASAEKKDQRLTVEDASAVPMVSADRGRLAQVIDNLVSNAIRHTPDGGAITLSARAGEEEVWFEVRDGGVGIAPDELPRLFDRFYQGEGNDRRGGAGLGLAIAKGLVEAHGGTIEADSEPGRGSVFRFSIPRDR